MSSNTNTSNEEQRQNKKEEKTVKRGSKKLAMAPSAIFPSLSPLFEAGSSSSNVQHMGVSNQGNDDENTNNKMASNTSQKSEWGNASMMTARDRRMSSNTNTSREERKQKKKERKIHKKLLATTMRPACSSGDVPPELSQFLAKPTWDVDPNSNSRVTNSNVMSRNTADDVNINANKTSNAASMFGNGVDIESSAQSVAKYLSPKYQTENSDDVFEYLGNGQSVPRDVVSVRFHPSVTKVDDEAFSRCSDLRELVLNEGLKKLENQVFIGCESLERISFPSSVTDIGHRAFYDCKRLRVVVFSEGLETIGEQAFDYCTSLESITLPSTVTDIGWYAFRGCTSLQSVTLPSKVVDFGNGAFYGCSSLQSITIPSSAIEICYIAFEKCIELKEVVLNEGLQKIEVRAFSNCSSLESITLPSTLIEIKKGAFYRCRLKNVVLNEGLKKIEGGAFDGCISLESITLPSSVEVIGNSAFKSCTILREVACSGALPSIKWNTFSGCPLLERITFPNLSSRLEDIIQAGQADVQNKIQQYINRGEIEWERGGTIHIPAEVTSSRERWGLVQQRLGQIINWIKYYELKEATTLFELALWKAKITMMDRVEDDIYTRDRDTYRVDVPGPVKDAILQCLYGIEIPLLPSYQAEKQEEDAYQNGE